MLLPVLTVAVSCAADAAPKPFVEGAKYDKQVPSPAAVIGHEVGERAVRYDALAEYLKDLAQASDKVLLTSYGKSHEGRELYYLTITSKANHKRLEKIREDNAKLADPRKLSDGEEQKLIENMPAVAWMNYSIHGDELSSTDAALYVAYHLAAAKDAETGKLLDEIVIHINPLVNPDGRERYLSYLEQLTGVVSSPDYQSMQHQALWSRGRGNHYLFDLNRDWLVQRQPEVKSLAAQILKWCPHLLVDSHEQGPFDTYLFDPPREPITAQQSQKVMQWRERFGRDQAEAFNRYGWSYYTKEWYSDWGPMYTNSWASVLGSIGLLYEQARVDQASVKHPTGEEISYRETVHHHIVSSLANLETLRSNHKVILSDFLSDRKWAIDEQSQYAGIFLLPPGQDKARFDALVELMQRQGIEVEYAMGDFEATELTDVWGDNLPVRKFAAGTVVVKSAQPNRRMLHALFDFDARMPESFLLTERKELENRRPSKIYDVTTWNLPMAFGLECYRAAGISDVELRAKPPAKKGQASKLSEAGYGYLIDFDSSQLYAVLVRLFESGCAVRIANKPFDIGGRKYKAGTCLLRGHENPENLYEAVREIAREYEVVVSAVDGALSSDGPDLGGREFVLLAEPKVAIASQWPVSGVSFGSVWHALDNQIQLRCSPINVQSIGRLDLRKYNVLVLPDSQGLERVIAEEDTEKMKEWVEGGGTLICIDGSAMFASGEERGLSSVRLRRDVLDKLEEYAEATRHEKDARQIKIDVNEIWSGRTEAEPDAARDEEDSDKGEKAEAADNIEKLKRSDEWQRIFSPQGTFLRGIVDTEYWLAFGLGEQLPVMFAGESVYMSQHPVSTPVRMAEKERLRLSGLLWPEAKGRIADSAYATVERVGRGQIILFATDPTFRCWLAGSQRLFLNAVLLGPGMGADQPMPW